MKSLPLAIERLQSKGPTLDQIESFLKVLPLHIRAMVQFTVSDDHEIALTIFRGGQRCEALFDVDPERGLYVTWLYNDGAGNIKPGESRCVPQLPDTHEVFKNAVIAWFSEV